MRATITLEQYYRRQAAKLLKNLSIGRKWLSIHKASLGAYSEHILIQLIKDLIPDEYDSCQGFVTDGNKTSKQCDVIIYRKGKSIVRSFGSIKFIKAESVVAVVEVKSSVQEKTFHSTLEAFEKLQTLGVVNTFLFVYNSLSKNSILKWLFSYKLKDSDTEIGISETYLYDWSDKNWLPNAILSLNSESLYSQEYAPYDDGDWFGYSTYSFFDGNDTAVSCLQEFLMCILRLVNVNTPDIDFQRLTLNKAILLFH